jgi:hypothetical protein
MMNKVDAEEKEISTATAANSATIRCLLALRNVLSDPADKITGETFPPNLSCVVCQLSQECEYIRATSFARQNGKPLLFARNLTSSKDAMLFNCALTPGLSQVFMNLLNFESTSIRSRQAGAFAAGPDHSVGWMVGRKVQECLLHHQWVDGIVLGFGDDKADFFKGEERGADRTFVGDYGLMGDPNRLVRTSDHVVFLSISSSPKPIIGSAVTSSEELSAFIPNASKAQSSVSLLRRGSSPSLLQGQPKARKGKAPPARLLSQKDLQADDDEKRVVVMGWRDEWEDEPLRVKTLLDGLGAVKVTVTFFNVKTKESMTSFCEKIDFHFIGDDNEKWRSATLTNITIKHHQVQKHKASSA